MNSFNIWKKNITRNWYTEYENSAQSTCFECFARITNENYAFNETQQADDSHSSAQIKFNIFHLEMTFSRETKFACFIHVKFERPCTLQRSAKFEIDSNQIFLVKNLFLFLVLILSNSVSHSKYRYGNLLFHFPDWYWEKSAYCRLNFAVTVGFKNMFRFGNQSKFISCTFVLFM